MVPYVNVFPSLLLSWYHAPVQLELHPRFPSQLPASIKLDEWKIVYVALRVILRSVSLHQFSVLYQQAQAAAD